MSKEHQESTSQEDKNSFLAAFGFVAIVIILIVSAANYLRIQTPRFQSINTTEATELKETTPAATEKPAMTAPTGTSQTPTAQPSTSAPQQEDTPASAH